MFMVFDWTSDWQKKNRRSRFSLADLFFLHPKIIIICTPDFFALHKHLPHSCFRFHICMSKCLLTFINKPCFYQKASLAKPTIPSLALMEGYHSKHQFMNLCMMANLLNQFSWQNMRFNFHWSNSTASFETDHFIDTLCKFLWRANSSTCLQYSELLYLCNQTIHKLIMW